MCGTVLYKLGFGVQVLVVRYDLPLTDSEDEEVHDLTSVTNVVRSSGAVFSYAQLRPTQESTEKTSPAAAKDSHPTTAGAQGIYMYLMLGSLHV